MSELCGKAIADFEHCLTTAVLQLRARSIIQEWPMETLANVGIAGLSQICSTNEAQSGTPELGFIRNYLIALQKQRMLKS